MTRRTYTVTDLDDCRSMTPARFHEPYTGTDAGAALEALRGILDQGHEALLEAAGRDLWRGTNRKLRESPLYCSRTAHTTAVLDTSARKSCGILQYEALGGSHHSSVYRILPEEDRLVARTRWDGQVYEPVESH